MADSLRPSLPSLCPRPPEYETLAHFHRKNIEALEACRVKDAEARTGVRKFAPDISPL
jgi:hypothetical protein